MVKATFYNMRLLCYTEDTDFTDYQGIGSDPMYRRFESVSCVIKNNINERFQSFLSRPFYENGVISWYVEEWKESPICYTMLNNMEKEKYSRIKDETLQHYKQKMQNLNAEDYAIMSGALKFINDEFIYCYDNKITLVAWGMRPDTSKHLIAGSWIKGLKIEEKCKINFDVGAHGKLLHTTSRVINREKGYKLTSKDLPEIVANEGYLFMGWSPIALGKEITEDCNFLATYKIVEQVAPSIKNETVKVIFDANDKGTLKGINSIECLKGHTLELFEIPIVESKSGFKFLRWSPNISQPILVDTVFSAEYEQAFVHCRFEAGNNGSLKGKNEILKSFGTILSKEELPIVIPKKGYKFTGWHKSPFITLNDDITFFAQYEGVIPWYKKIWLWFSDFGCLKWILGILLFLLLILLLSFLLRGCNDSLDQHATDRFGMPILEDDSVAQIDRVNGNDGIERDFNGRIGNILDEKGDLPKQGIVAPIIGDGGEEPVVIKNQGIPDVIGNRLNIYFDNEDADLNKWAQNFKKVYPSDEYQIIGYDQNVRMIQIQIPENQRNKVREEINTKISDQEFFVVDESIIKLQGHITKYQTDSSKGWHLKATNVKQAWSITMGNPDVVVAIVDDGIDSNHSLLKGRFYKAYNVFTQNRTLGVGQGHGTHVAGLAVGSEANYENGVAGVAPRCKIMPIQVFDNGMCTFSSIASGIMYAIHNGAHIVNVSIGPSFQGLDQIPISEQQKIAEMYFKNEERVYRHIIQTANEKNVILVFAAGNDNIMTAILPECRSVEKSINVAAVATDFKSSNFTNYSVGTNISAPGVNIYSSFPNNSYKILDGTSMAAPIVSGTIALMRSLNPHLTVNQIIGVLQQTGRSTDNYIPPMLLIDRALEAVKNGDIPEGPVLTVKSGIDESAVQSDDYNFNDENNDNADDYSALRSKLENLKIQRAVIDKKIEEIEQKMK